MLGEYTIEAGEYTDFLVESDAARIWADIERQDEDTDAEAWRKKLEAIAREYRVSGRFALMRILHSRVYAACGAGKEKKDPNPDNWADALWADEFHFKTRVRGKWVLFRDISMAHAFCLSPEENQAYIDLLEQTAQEAPDTDPAFREKHIARAWHDGQRAGEKEGKRKYASRITREEAFALGHILSFTVEEMQWFLLRVFDTENGFRLNRSEDLIELYCFHTGGSCRTVQKLKDAYDALSAGIPKVDDAVRNRNWTARVSGGLMEQLESWMRFPETCEANFLHWLEEHASGLDVPSRTALRIYRNLAACACDLVTGRVAVPEEEEIQDVIQRLCAMETESEAAKRHLFQDGVLSENLCGKTARLLLRDNKERSESLRPDNTVAWSVVSLRSDGSLSPAAGVVNESRTRVRDILLGSVEMEKGDMLYLLWFLLNIVWYAAEELDVNGLYCRILDLKDTAAMVLEAAGLPEFYHPHLMEQSMLLSIVCAGKGGFNPTEVYEEALQSIRCSRNREEGSRKHTLQQKIEIVEAYRSSGMTLDACAKAHGISPKTLSAWQKTLTDKGLISR